MSDKPTPGPWRLERYPDDDEHLRYDAAIMASDGAEPVLVADVRDADADGALLLAAPTLLEAAKVALEEFFKADFHGWPEANEARDKLRAAIALAEGSTP